MASTIKKSNEVVLYRKQFDALVEAGKLNPGSTYHIVDDPTIADVQVELDTKVDKTSTSYRVYGTDHQGNQIVYRINTANEATVNAIPYRGSNGAIYIPDASIEDSGNVVEGQQAVNKKYVNTLLESYTVTTEVGNKISASIDSTSYVLTLNLLNSSDEVLSTGTIDLPLETVVIGARYEDGKLYLTTKDGKELDGIDISNIISGLVPDTRTINGKALSSDITLNVTDLPDNENYVKKTDFATSTQAGIIKANSTQGFYISPTTGDLSIVQAQDSDLTTKTNKFRPITSNNLDKAVKVGMTTNAEEWTDDEKKAARDLIGAGTVNDVSNKVDIIEGSGLYLQNTNGTRTLKPFGQNVPGSGQVVTWTSDKTIRAADPIADNDVVTKSYMETNGGKIDTISVNGETQTVENKNVDISVPTKVSQLENDSKYIRQDEVDFSNFYTKSETYSQEEVDNLIEENKFSGNYNDLTNKPTIPSIEGLASEDYVDKKVSDLVNTAPETLDTLGEIADALKDNKDIVSVLENSIATKADQTEVDALSTNKVNRSELAAVATTGSYTDLKNKPVAVDNLESTSTIDFLSANQGKVLNTIKADKTALNQEITDRQNAINTIQTNLNQEIENRTTAEAQLRKDITQNTTDISALQTTSETHTTDISKLKTDLSNEITTRETNDAEVLEELEINGERLDVIEGAYVKYTEALDTSGTVDLFKDYYSKSEIDKKFEEFNVDTDDIVVDVPITSISVNNTAVDVINKNVNINVPTKTPQLINDSSYITESTSALTNYYTKTEINTTVSTNITNSENTLNAKIDKNAATAKTYTDDSIVSLRDELLGPGSTEALDTIKELASAMAENDSMIDTLNSAIGTKATQTDLNAANAQIADIKNTYLPLSGGQLVGRISFKDTNALPEATSTDFFLGIDSYATGGGIKYINKEQAWVGEAGCAGYLKGFKFAPTSQTWGNQTGTFICGMDDETSGSLAFRRDNPTPGQLSMIIDGTVYVNEGNDEIATKPWANSTFVNTTGDTMTGPLTIGACTLQYNSTNNSLDFIFN